MTNDCEDAKSAREKNRMMNIEMVLFIIVLVNFKRGAAQKKINYKTAPPLILPPHLLIFLVGRDSYDCNYLSAQQDEAPYSFREGYPTQ